MVEADESDRSLLKLHPTIAVVTNAELDHHTTYSSQRDVDETFRAFLALAREQVVPEDLVRLAERPTVFGRGGRRARGAGRPQPPQRRRRAHRDPARRGRRAGRRRAR